jgi:hypothetical protein
MTLPNLTKLAEALRAFEKSCNSLTAAFALAGNAFATFAEALEQPDSKVVPRYGRMPRPIRDDPQA